MLSHELSLIIPLVIGAVIGVLVWSVRESNERDRARGAGETPRRISPWGSIVVCAAIGGVVIGGFWNASHESQARAAAHDALQHAFDSEGATQIKLSTALRHPVTTQADLDAFAAAMHEVERDALQAQATFTGLDRGDYGPDELALVDTFRRVNVTELDSITAYERLIDGHAMSVAAGVVQLAPADRTAMIERQIALFRAWLTMLAPEVKLGMITPAMQARVKQQLEQGIATLQSCLCQLAA
jgi:hypothetical protein